MIHEALFFVSVFVAVGSFSLQVIEYRRRNGKGQ